MQIFMIVAEKIYPGYIKGRERGGRIWIAANERN